MLARKSEQAMEEKMKLRFTYILVVLFLLFGIADQARATDPDCNSNGEIHDIYYMSCFARLSGETTDDERIQRAINAIPSGKLIFNEGLYTVDDTVTLHGYLTLEGTSTNTLAETSIPTSSHIKMTATNKAIFKIGETVYDVAIRDLGLSATSRTGTVGILGEGTGNSSLHFEFGNIRFSNLAFGIKVQGVNNTGWQFDNVKVDHCLFEGVDTGIYVDSYNSGWQISSIEFASMLAGQIGLDLVRITYSEINSVIGNGRPPGETPAYALIRVKEHANLSINNVVSEGVEYDLKVEGISLNYPIYLYNNTFQDKVDISGATVYAASNQYGIEYPNNTPPVPQSPQPIARNAAQIYSYGEKFCFEGSTDCSTAGWQFLTDANMVSSTNQYKNYWSRPSLFENVLEVNTNDPLNPTTSPLVSIIAPTYSGKALLRLGQSNYHYTLSRNGTNGWLDFKGNQSAPYTGFSFNGPVKLPSYAQSALPTILENGTMVFCSDCQANNSACSGGGNGALAVAVNSAWVCK